MRSTDWIVSVAFTFFSYLFFVHFESLRLAGVAVFPFLFAFYISSDEWRVGRAVLQAILPVILSVVLVFVVSLLWTTVISHSTGGELLSASAYAFLLMLFLVGIVGLPLACAGVFVRHYRLVRVSD